MNKNQQTVSLVKCGIIMPISSFGGYSKKFWGEIKNFLEDTISSIGMIPQPVWEDKTNDIIHAKIVSNISELPVVIGVIIGRNPNVMLECGMRLWTNLPIALINAEGENPPFDVSSIPCLTLSIVSKKPDFSNLKEKLEERLRSMMANGYKPFKSYYSIKKVDQVPKVCKQVAVNKAIAIYEKKINQLAEFAQAALDEWLMFILMKMRWGDECRISYYEKSHDTNEFIPRARNSPLKEFRGNGRSGVQNNKNSLVRKAWDSASSDDVFVFSVPSNVVTKEGYIEYVANTLNIPKEDAKELSMYSHFIMARCVYECNYQKGVVVVERMKAIEGEKNRLREMKRYKRLIKEFMPHFITMLHKEEAL